ncbi:MAG: GAF domain-containing protein [Deltaproteobacteria bacterium]|nr:MAG: GAF domain-containing protein [Deltaproteobacteria bacterium]
MKKKARKTARTKKSKNESEPNFRDDDLSLAEQEAIDLKFELSRLKEKIRIQEAELDVFREMSNICSSSFELDHLLDRYMDLVLKIMRSEAGTLYLTDESKKDLIFNVVKGKVKKKITGMRIGLGEGIAGWVAQQGRPYVATDVKNDPRWLREVGDRIKFDIRDILCVPLRTSNKTIGSIEIINKMDGKSFQREDLELLISLANQIAMVIENAHLLLDKEKTLSQLSGLTAISALLSSSLDPRVVRRRTMEAATQLMDCETGSLFLIDEENNELYFEVALGEKGEKVKQIRLKMGEGIAGWVAQHGKPLLIADATKDSRWFRKADRTSKFVTRNMLCVPVKVKDKVIGVLEAINKHNGATFTQEDLELLNSLANEVGIAIDNANLYEEKRNTFLQTAEALADAIDKRDPYTGGHTKRVTSFSLAMAKYLDLDPADSENLKLAAILHDIGKIGIPDDVLRKKSKLTDTEFDSIKKHPIFGYEIMSHIKSLKDVIPGMRYHHERPDGKGYPERLKGDKIPLIARIISIADTFDAMTSDRPYRKGLSDEEALNELKRCAGTQLDPMLVKIFLKAYQKGEIASQKK